MPGVQLASRPCCQDVYPRQFAPVEDASVTPAQYRLHRCATMRAAMRASAQFLTLAAGVRSGCWPADLAGVSDRAPGAEPHDRAPGLRADADMAERIERLRAVA